MRVSDGRVDQFPRMLGEGWQREAVGDGSKQLVVRHLVLSIGADC